MNPRVPTESYGTIRRPEHLRSNANREIRVKMLTSTSLGVNDVTDFTSTSKSPAGAVAPVPPRSDTILPPLSKNGERGVVP